MSAGKGRDNQEVLKRQRICFVLIRRWGLEVDTDKTKRNFMTNVTLFIFHEVDCAACDPTDRSIAQSGLSNNLSLMFLLHVSTSTVSSSRRHIQRDTSTTNADKAVSLNSYNTVLLFKVTKNV